MLLLGNTAIFLAAIGSLTLAAPLKNDVVSHIGFASLTLAYNLSQTNRIRGPHQSADTCNQPATANYISEIYSSSFPLTHKKHGNLNTIVVDAVQHIAWVPLYSVTDHDVTVAELENRAIPRVEWLAQVDLLGPHSSLTAEQLSDIICKVEDHIVSRYPPVTKK